MTTSLRNETTVRLDHNGYRLFAGMLLYMGLQAAVLFVAAGTVRWPAAWAYLGVYALCAGAGMAWVARVNPAVVNERGKRPENMADFDRRFQRIVPLIIFGSLAIGGLDRRFAWSDVPIALQVAGCALLALAVLLAAWVLATNAFAARVVRLQEAQSVVTAGPYRFVRHPMYAGTLLAWVAAALTLDSWWMLVPAALGIALFVWRTAREDTFLQDRLPGYPDYAKRTRYRLLPGIW